MTIDHIHIWRKKPSQNVQAGAAGERAEEQSEQGDLWRGRGLCCQAVDPLNFIPWMLSLESLEFYPLESMNFIPWILWILFLESLEFYHLTVNAWWGVGSSPKQMIPWIRHLFFFATPLFLIFGTCKGSAGWALWPGLLAEHAEEGQGWDCPGLLPRLGKHLGVYHQVAKLGGLKQSMRHPHNRQFHHQCRTGRSRCQHRYQWCIIIVVNMTLSQSSQSNSSWV